MKTILTTLLLTASFAINLLAAENPAEPSQSAKGWPTAVKKITYPSAADNTAQPAMWYASTNTAARPLLVGLHSWSGDYTQTSSAPYAEWCIQHDWIFIHPNFRGVNNRPEATGSELTVKDIISAVEYAKKTAKVDASRIYLVGASGGGYSSLLMAGRAPEIWAGVSAWVPLNDLKAWYWDCVARKATRYASNIVSSLGGIPGQSAAADEQARLRSAATYLPKAKSVKLDINTGINDGYTGSVPIYHSLDAFNLVATPSKQISAADIKYMVEKRSVPDALKYSGVEDATYGAKKVLFRRESGLARVTVFDGTHEIITEAALNWLAQQRK